MKIDGRVSPWEAAPMGAPEEMMLALEGPGVTPDNVDSLTLLHLAEAWFSLNLKVAEAEGRGLTFTGLSVVRKCAAVVAQVSDLGNARVAAMMAVRIVSRGEDPPQGAVDASRRFVQALCALPATHSVKARVGAKWLPIKRPAPIDAPDIPWEVLEMRVTPVRVGGGKEPAAQLICHGEDAPFSLSVSEDDARVLGSSLYRPVDATLQFCRHHDGRIDRGRVLDVTLLDDVDPIAAWRAWFADDAAAWDEVDDIRTELGHA
jgi:hypothetical protein